jgi:uncharacterized surface protein with fasciclin (FAS1) repeats
MKPNWFKIIVLALALGFFQCNNSAKQEQTTQAPDPATSAGGGQASVQDDVSQKDIVKIAVGSPDHTTLVAALQAADYVNVVSNAGPFTVFAPTNAAFEKLPKGTVEELVKPEKKADLRNILEYHVTVGVYKTENMQDGQNIGQANGDNVKISIKDGKYYANDALIVASVPASNGIVHIVDGVLLPPAKK